MKTLLCYAILALASQSQNLAEAKNTPEDIALFDACKSFYTWQEYAPTCDQIVARSQHHLVLEADYKSYCGAATKFKAEAEANAAKYKKLTNHNVILSQCPEESKI